MDFWILKSDKSEDVWKKFGPLQDIMVIFTDALEDVVGQGWL